MKIRTRINITQQTNKYECGVCVLTSLYNYYYHSKQISKQQILDKASINENGLTIFNFEILANKFNLETDSYEINWTEFENLKVYHPFVCLIKSKFENNHYVIVVKNKKHIFVYDSCYSKPKKYSYANFRRVFCNVLIFIKKQQKLVKKIKVFQKNIFFDWDYKFFFISFLLACVSHMLLLLNSSFLKWVIDFAISKKSIQNLFIITINFLLISVIQNLFDYIHNLYFRKHLRSCCLIITDKILKSLLNKQVNFNYKFDLKWLDKIDECIFTLANYFIIDLNKHISNILVLCLYTCILCSVQWNMIIFIFLLFFVEVIVTFIKHWKKQKIYSSFLASENKTLMNISRIKNLFSNQIWPTKFNYYTTKLRENYSNIYKNFNDLNVFSSNTCLFEKITKTFIEIIFITLFSYSFIKNDSLSFGKLSFLLTSIQIIKYLFSEIGNYFLEKIKVNVFLNIYSDIISVGNLSSNKKTDSNHILDKCSKITFKLGNEHFVVYKNQYNRIRNFQLVLKKCNSIIVNNKEYSPHTKSIWKNLIIFNENIELSVDYFKYLYTNNFHIYDKYLKLFRINITNSYLTFRQRFFLNFLCLLNEKNKIIIFEKPEWKFDLSNKTVKEIFHQIKQRNSIFILEDNVHT